MLGPVNYLFWVGSFLLEVYIVVSSFFRKEFLRYFSFNLYMLSVALVNCGQYYCIRKFGFSSMSYAYFFYYTEFLLVLLMFGVIIQLYYEVFRERRVNWHITGATLVLILATGIFSYVVVRQNETRLTTRFVLVLNQNLHFVALAFTYVLWGVMAKLRETRTRLVQLVLALGISYSGTAVTFALRTLFPAVPMNALRLLPPLFGTWLPLAWAYTFTMVPEGARLEISPAVAGER